jgi:hypothetical protein
MVIDKGFTSLAFILVLQIVFILHVEAFVPSGKTVKKINKKIIAKVGLYHGKEA